MNKEELEDALESLEDGYTGLKNENEALRLTIHKLETQIQKLKGEE